MQYNLLLGKTLKEKDQLSECICDHLMWETGKQTNVPYEVRKSPYFCYSQCFVAESL